MARAPLPEPEPMLLTRLADIARGGMGSVELARVEDGRLEGQILAIKRLHTTIADDPQFVAMFLDEAWMTSSLHHPNVVELAALGTDARGLFLAIEFVQGVSLARLLKESRQNQEPFAERTVAHICSQICSGLVAAHDLRGPDGVLLGLVHRDLAPANVLVRFDGIIKIIDFGIAKAEERITHTRTGQLKGKPAYMAPEQARGRKVDLRADIFSFGVMMFEFLAGRRPFTAKVAFDVMMQIMNDPVPDLAELRPGLDPELIAIVNKCLEKNPEDRFSSAEEIQARLDGFRAQKGFLEGDLESLASFVVRNSTAQLKWYEAALEGQIAEARAPTFKELEEQIDAEREEKDGTRRRGSIRPAAGARTPSVAPAPGTRPADALLSPLPSPPAARPVSFEERVMALPPHGSGAPPGAKVSGSDYPAVSPLAFPSRTSPVPRGDPMPGPPAAGRYLSQSSPVPGMPAAPRLEGPSTAGPDPNLRRNPGAPAGAPAGLELASSTRVIIALVVLIVVLSVAAVFAWRRRIQKLLEPERTPAALTAPSPSSH